MAIGGTDSPLGQSQQLPALVNAGAAVLHELRLALEAILARVGHKQPSGTYETLWLELSLELSDVAGERAVLSRRQCIRCRGTDATVVRELVWGEGDQLVRYTAAGARRLTVQAEGSKRAVLLSPTRHPEPGDRLTITSRRVIRGGFSSANEYCEAFLERPTGQLAFVVRFPRGRPPRQVQLVLASTERVLRRLLPRYAADGRAVVRCRLPNPVTGSVYSLRWSW